MFNHFKLVQACYFEMSVESDATPILVAAGQRYKIELFCEGCARCDWTTLVSLQAGHVSRELSIYHGYFAMLNHVYLRKNDKKNDSEQN